MAVGLPRWLLWWGRPPGMAAAALLLILSVLLAPQLAGRSAALPAEWAWAAGLTTVEDPLDSEWDESSLVLEDTLPVATPELAPPGGRESGGS